MKRCDSTTGAQVNGLCSFCGGRRRKLGQKPWYIHAAVACFFVVLGIVMAHMLGC